MILVINCGSSSFKFKLYTADSLTLRASGQVERIGQAKSPVKIRIAGESAARWEQVMPNHEAAIRFVLQQLVALHALNNLNEIKAVGHRVVAGGEEFDRSVVVTDEVRRKINVLAELAPLHNPANLQGIELCQRLLPQAMAVAAFDTAFHQTLPPKHYMYSVPYDWYFKYHVRRYGAHGISHRYIVQETARQLHRKETDLTMISCHLGAGSSVCAVDHGCSVDISMGFTPLTGLQMATRSGDVDASLVAFMVKKLGIKTVDEMTYLLNKQSGFKGLAGSADMRDVEQMAAQGNPRAQLALELYNTSVIRYVGQYITELKGVDAITFTAGIGENSPEVRAAVLSQLGYLGVQLDKARNKVRGQLAEITTPDSSIRAFVIPTDEERMIAQDVQRLLAKL
ncbi:acetate/propionate family kinase [Ligilactobacillus sp. LYQ60]|uniref:acetate/propionate family kinase n=1 Tax=Ligilactobacillus sp. LYQ60 TaxID=3378799 RepID=UPI003852C08D